MLALNLGRRKVGKTTLGYKIVSRCETILIFDPRGQFRTSKCVLSSASGLWEALDNENEIIVQPSGDTVVCFGQVCDTLKKWIAQYPEAKVSFLVDESYFIKTPEVQYESFDAMLRFTEQDQLLVVMTAHRPGDIATSIRAIADIWCMFKTTQEHDLKVIRERCGSEVAETVYNLKPREYVLWNDGEGTWEKKTDPAKWFISMKELKDVRHGV